MTPSELVEHLKELPAVELMIIPLAWELLGEDGRIDDEKVRFSLETIAVARDQVIAYAHNTYQLTEALKKCLELTDL